MCHNLTMQSPEVGENIDLQQKKSYSSLTSQMAYIFFFCGHVLLYDSHDAVLIVVSRM